MNPTLRTARTSTLAAALALAAALPSVAGTLNPNPHSSAFVVTYRCDGGKWLAIAYPAPFARATEPPARLSWNGGTVLMSIAQSGSGARYVNQANDLEWWNKGRGGNLRRLSDGAPLASNCEEA